jgi:hypothetical protein
MPLLSQRSVADKSWVSKCHRHRRRSKPPPTMSVLAADHVPHGRRTGEPSPCALEKILSCVDVIKQLLKESVRGSRISSVTLAQVIRSDWTMFARGSQGFLLRSFDSCDSIQLDVCHMDFFSVSLTHLTRSDWTMRVTRISSPIVCLLR